MHTIIFDQSLFALNTIIFAQSLSKGWITLAGILVQPSKFNMSTKGGTNCVTSKYYQHITIHWEKTMKFPSKHQIMYQGIKSSH